MFRVWRLVKHHHIAVLCDPAHRSVHFYDNPYPVLARHLRDFPYFFNLGIYPLVVVGNIPVFAWALVVAAYLPAYEVGFPCGKIRNVALVVFKARYKIHAAKRGVILHFLRILGLEAVSGNRDFLKFGARFAKKAESRRNSQCLQN